MQVQVEVQAVSNHISVCFIEPDVEALWIVALLLVFTILYLWMVWAYIKVGPTTQSMPSH